MPILRMNGGESVKRLYRSRSDVMIVGVLAGIAEYFGHDSTIWRLAFVAFLVLTGIMPGVLLYIIAWIVIPLEPDIVYREVKDG